MKANTQYNDLRGTSAADITDFSDNSIEKYLKNKFRNFDADRYIPVGCRIRISGDLGGHIEYICKDLNTNTHVILQSNSEEPLEEIFSLFKRFDIVLKSKYDNEDWQIDQDNVVELDKFPS